MKQILIFGFGWKGGDWELCKSLVETTQPNSIQQSKYFICSDKVFNVVSLKLGSSLENPF